MQQANVVHIIAGLALHRGLFRHIYLGTIGWKALTADRDGYVDEEGRASTTALVRGSEAGQAPEKIVAGDAQRRRRN